MEALMKTKRTKVRAIELYRDNRFKPKVVESKTNYKRNKKHKKSGSEMDRSSFF
jgi:hypothetical protein